MSQKVNAVPDASFSVPPLTTTAGTRVSRRRIKVPCNYPGTNYGHNGQSALPSVVTFDIADNESFLDMDKSMIVLDFKPEFFGNESVVSKHHSIGFDGSSQSLIARVRIGNSQGLIIEECQAYGTWANIMDSYSQSENETEHHLLEQSSALKNFESKQKSFGTSEPASQLLQSHAYRRLFLKFKHSSFLKSCRMIPLFLMRNGIRFEIEFENVYKCLTRSYSPSWQGPYFANTLGQKDLSRGANLAQRFDWWFVQGFSPNRHETALVVPMHSMLAQKLGFRELLLSNLLRSEPIDGVPSVNVIGKIMDGGWAFPIKIEYTDTLGTSHVLVQGIAVLESQVYDITANGSAELTNNVADVVTANQVTTITENLAKQYYQLAKDFHVNAPRAGKLNSPPNIPALADTVNEAPGFRLRLISKFDGFDRVNRVSGAEILASAGFLPYSDRELCLYADPSDMHYVPSVEIPNIGSSVSFRKYTAFANPLPAVYTLTYSANNVGEQPRYAHWSIGNSPWNYSIKNVEMICDFVKPSSEVFLQFQQSFQAPAGIPYAYKRVLYHTRVLNPSDGLQQISLPISVRSLRGVVCVLSDKLAWSPSSDNTSKSFNGLSAFMKRGLIRGQLVIGGQNYPSYDLNLTENGFEQIPELECLFNVAALGSFNPAFDQKELLSSRNYLLGSGKSNNGTAPYDGGWVDVTSDFNPASGNNSMGFQQYNDTGKFVLGLSTMKKDGDFVTGVDTSQAGSVSLNLYFKRSPDLANMFPGDSGSNRDIFVQVFCLADAVFTLQNDANLVRY